MKFLKKCNENRELEKLRHQIKLLTELMEAFLARLDVVEDAVEALLTGDNEVTNLLFVLGKAVSQ